MWEVCSFLWKLLKLVARGHRCSLDSSRHNYSSSPQKIFSVSSNNNHKVSEAAIEIVYTHSKLFSFASVCKSILKKFIPEMLWVLFLFVGFLGEKKKKLDRNGSG